MYSPIYELKCPAETRMAWSFWSKAGPFSLPGQGQCPLLPTVLFLRREGSGQCLWSSRRGVSTKPGPEVALARARSCCVAPRGKEGQPFQSLEEQPL